MVPRSQRWHDKGKPAVRLGRKATGPSGSPGYRKSSFHFGRHPRGKSEFVPVAIEMCSGWKLASLPGTAPSFRELGAGPLLSCDRPASKRASVMFNRMTNNNSVSMRQTTKMFCVSGVGLSTNACARPFTSSLPARTATHGFAIPSETTEQGFPFQPLDVVKDDIERRTQRDLWGLGHVVIGGDDASSLERWGQDQRTAFRNVCLRGQTISLWGVPPVI